MPTWMKVVLIVGGILVVLFLVLAGVGVYLVRKHVPGMIESGKQAYSEGAEFGRGTDNEGCLSEAISRHSRNTGMGDTIKNSLFLRSCLDNSQPTPGFCDAIPRASEFIKSAQWQLQQCTHHGLGGDQQCGQLFAQVQQFCEQRVRQQQRQQNDAPPPPAPKPTR